MGRPKASLPWHGQTLLARVVGILARSGLEPIVVVRAAGQSLPPLPSGVEIVTDAHRDRGPLEGLAAGLGAIEGRAEIAFVSSTDVPFLLPAFVEAVVSGLDDSAEIAAPQIAGRSHPLSAAYRATACPRVKAVLAMAGDLANANNPHVRNAGVPILHVMETEDEYDPYPHSIQWDRDNLDAPRWMLTLPGSSHVPPYTQPGNTAFELVSAATVDFFDGTLKGHPEQLDAMAKLVADSGGVGTLER